MAIVWPNSSRSASAGSRTSWRTGERVVADMDPIEVEIIYMLRSGSVVKLHSESGLGSGSEIIIFPTENYVDPI